MAWFWNFVIYSFLGFLLEAAFARVSGGRPDRKCLLLLPLCPVYGLGAEAILLLAPLAGNHPARLFLLGGAAATAVEYAVGWWYETFLGVAVWDSTGLPGSLQGRVCLPFSLAWGGLSLPLVYFVHPAVSAWTRAVPGPVTLSMAALVLADLAVSAVLLKVTGDRASLQWYRR